MLREKAKNFKSIFNKFWNKKIFKFALLLHISYLIIAIIITLISYREFNDFVVFYEVGKVFLHNIKTLYDPSNYLWPFRYFPLGAIIFIPFSLLPFELAFILFNVFNLFVNFLICGILYKIVGLFPQNEKLLDIKIFFISLYLIALPHVINYAMGQVNSLVSIFLLWSLYIFLKYDKIKWNFFAGILVGVSINLKPITIFIIPFLISFSIISKSQINKTEITRSITRVFGAFIPILLNFPLFLIIPELLTGFININFTGTDTLIVNNSFSITKLIINALTMLGFEINLLQDLQIIIILVVFLLIGGIGILLFIIRKLMTNSIVYGYILGIIIILLVYFDSWDLHLIILIPLLLISIISISEISDKANHYFSMRNIMRKSFYFFIFIDLPIFGLIYLLRDIFPYNFIPTIFLLLLFVSIGKYLLKEEPTL